MVDDALTRAAQILYAHEVWRQFLHKGIHGWTEAVHADPWHAVAAEQHRG